MYIENIEKYIWGTNIDTSDNFIPIDSSYNYVMYDSPCYAGISSYKDNSDKLQDNSKLYISSLSKIPRTLVRNKYTIVRNPAKADFFVIPSIPNVKEDNVAIFTENDDGYTNEGYIGHDINFIKENKIKDIAGYAAIKGTPYYCNNCDLIYTGKIKLFQSYKDLKSYKQLALLSLDKDKIIFEYSLLNHLEGDNLITEESLTSLIDMFESNDLDNRKLAIVMLSTMNYYRFPTTTKFLIYNYWRTATTTTNNSSVAFMRHYIELNPQDYTLSNPGVPISKEDYDMLVFARCKVSNVTDPKNLYWTSSPVFK